MPNVTAERFFIPAPSPSSQTKMDDANNTFPVYLNDRGEPLMWSGDFPLPAVGSRVFITMNNIGWAVVKGYFESYGYLGLMTLPLSPPEWLIKQRGEALKERNSPHWVREGIGCEFGSELSLKRPK